MSSPTALAAQPRESSRIAPVALLPVVPHPSRSSSPSRWSSPSIAYKRRPSRLSSPHSPHHHPATSPGSTSPTREEKRRRQEELGEVRRGRKEGEEAGAPPPPLCLSHRPARPGRSDADAR